MGDTTIADYLKCRNLRNQANPQMPSLIQSIGCKSKIPKKSSSFRAFGCTAQPEVSLPSLIRSSATWQDPESHNQNNKLKKNRKKNNKVTNQQQQQQELLLVEDCIGVHDLWCADASSAASVDCVRPLPPPPSRPKIDLHKERPSYSSRQRVNAEPYTSMGLDSSFDTLPIGPHVFEARYYHHLRNRSPEALAQMLMNQSGLMAHRRPAGPDRYREWRLDVDNMTYEELLELSDKIGYVSTGLAEDQIGKCLRKSKLPVLNELPSQTYKSMRKEEKCSICQEDYEGDDEVGSLECGHEYHLQCIKQWLLRRNTCPICKVEASSL